MLSAKRLILIKTNIGYTLTCFCYHFMYFISYLSNAVFIHSLFYFTICLKKVKWFCFGDCVEVEMLGHDHTSHIFAFASYVQWMVQIIKSYLTFSLTRV